MNGQLDFIMRRIWERKVSFFTVFFIVVLITYTFLVAIDFIPEAKETTDNQQTDEENAKTESSNSIVPDFSKRNSQLTPETEIGITMGTNPLPIKIIFDDLKKEVLVLNPESNDYAVLDEALLKGVVRHPDSADFSSPGNVFLLGHSSYLPNVMNKNFQAFNGIQKLTWGDIIRVQTADTEYLYRVDEVFEAPASEIFVPETPGEAKLTLATCNVLGAKEDRFIVEATLFDTKPL